MVGWAIVGTGSVARKMAVGLRQSAGGKAVAVVGRDLARTRAFADDFGIPDATTDLAAALKLPGVGAVYIATPPVAHRDAALACIAAGKPVLIEKPFTASAADTAAIINAARSAGVFAMEGMWTRFLPLLAEVRRLVRDGAIGEIRSLEGSFGASNRADASDNQFVAALGGGALLHRGVYPLALAIDLLGPAELAGSVATIGASGVDEDVVVMLRHASNALSTIRASLCAPLANDLSIEGTHGRIHIAAPIFRPWRATVTRTEPARRGGKPRFEGLRESSLAQGAQQRLAWLRRDGTTITRHFSGNGYHYEVDAVMAAIRDGAIESPLMPMADSLHIAELIEAARARWHTGVIA